MAQCFFRGFAICRHRQFLLQALHLDFHGFGLLFSLGAQAYGDIDILLGFFQRLAQGLIRRSCHIHQSATDFHLGAQLINLALHLVRRLHRFPARPFGFLNGLVTPNGLDTAVVFRWGTNMASLDQTATASPPTVTSGWATSVIGPPTGSDG